MQITSEWRKMMLNRQKISNNLPCLSFGQSANQRQEFMKKTPLLLTEAEGNARITPSTTIGKMKTKCLGVKFFEKNLLRQFYPELNTASPF